MTLIAGGGPALAQSSSGAPDPKVQPDYDQTKDYLWTLEQSIYAGRAKGNMSAYAANQSPYYKPWPIGWGPPPKPMSGVNGLKGDKEKVEMTFVNMAYNGHTAVMMYKTHRTQTSDGKPADDYFEVTHVWSKLDGKWKLLGARPQAVQPPGK